MKRKLDKRSKEIEFKEKELEKREKEFSLKQREIEHKQIASQIDNIASHNIYTSNKGQSGKTHKHSPVPPKLSTDDGKTEWRPYLITSPKNTTGQMQKSWTNLLNVFEIGP